MTPHTLWRHQGLTALLSAVLGLFALPHGAWAQAGAGATAAERWVDKEFQPSSLTRAQQLAEMKWFADAADRLKALGVVGVQVVSEKIDTHDYESRALVDAERARRHGEAGEASSLVAVDSEPGGEEDGAGERVVGRAEAVDPPLLEPRHLIRRQAGALRGLLDRELAAQPRRVARGALEGCLGEWAGALDDLSCIGSPERSLNLPGRSACESTSPGAPRSSHGTRSGRRRRRPSFFATFARMREVL